MEAPLGGSGVLLTRAKSAESFSAAQPKPKAELTGI